ncbi:MAG TPA: DUF6289 family protein [Thermoanaerobaculia bacterium]|jgi:hypothetical protein|nr:DUF6289 family protein [Thermoanaerobaculia bacterium]
MSAFRSRRLLLAFALVLVLAVTFLTSPRPSEAQSRCGNEFFYYSDETYSEIVGYEVWDCNCYHSYWGERTEYREIVPLEYC